MSKLIISFVAILGGAVGVLAPNCGWAQVPPSYTAYYTSRSAATPGASMAVQSPNDYLYDKYFYQRPTVSPYINLGRGGSDMANYQTYIRPELERREAWEASTRTYVQQRKLEGRVGDTRHPGAIYGPGNELMRQPQKVTTNPNAYYNHWYGGWANK